MVYLIGKYAKLEYLDVGVKTTKSSYLSTLLLIAEIGPQLTALQSLSLAFSLTTSIGAEKPIIWRFASSLKSIQISLRGLTHYNSDFYQALPVVIMAPFLLEWEGPLSLLCLANLLQSSPCLENLTGHVEGQGEDYIVDEKDEKAQATTDIGWKAITDAFANGYGSKLKTFTMLNPWTRSTEWPNHMILPMISCCSLLEEVLLVLGYKEPIEPVLRLLSNLRSLKELRLNGSNIVRNPLPESASLSSKSNIPFPKLRFLGLVACDEQLLTDLDIPTLQGLRLRERTCDLISFEAILNRFPQLEDLSLTDVGVCWDREKQQPIDVLPSLQIIKNKLSNLHLATGQVNMLLVENLLLSCPLTHLLVTYTIAVHMADTIGLLCFTTNANPCPWPLLKSLRIIFYGEEEGCTVDDIIFLAKNLICGMPSLKILTLPPYPQDLQILRELNVQSPRLKIAFAS